jgi:hypothetical protein
MNQLVPFTSSHAPTIVAAAGDRAEIRFLEFFAANIRNKNTRRGYVATLSSSKYPPTIAPFGLVSSLDERFARNFDTEKKFLPLAFPKPVKAGAFRGQTRSKPLIPMVGAQGLEPWTR